MLTNLDPFDAPMNMSADDSAEPILRFPRAPQPFTRAQNIYLPWRRSLDLALALSIAVVTLPIMLLAALIVRLTSRGPAFYAQTRVGRNGRVFTIFKLRSMIHKCESLTGPRWTIPGDPRVTPIGWLLRRTHIDELPQLWNVLKGEMSLIGPRPERPEFVSELEKALGGYAERHVVLPGITGLAQVQLPPDSDLDSVRRKLVCDLHYVQQFGLLLDLRILLATGLHMLGVPFAMLQRMGVVPVPGAAAEAPRVERVRVAA